MVKLRNRTDVIDVEYSVKKLMQDRTLLVCMMEKFQNNDAAYKAIIIELNDVFLKIGNLCIT